MQHLLTAALLAALAAAPLRADEPKETPKDEKPSMEKRFQEITQEFKSAQEPLVKEFGAAKSDEERQAVVARLPKLAAPFAAKAIALAEEDLKNPVAIRCLHFALSAGKSERAVELLIG